MSLLLKPVSTKLDCPLCGEQPVKPFLLKPRDFQIYTCTSCGLGQTLPFPKESNGQEYYSDSEEYFANHYATNKKIWRRFMALLLDRAKPYVKDGTILDIGTGIGFMLELAQERGFKATGIDPSPAATRYAREKLHLEVFQGLFPNSELAGRKFDLITLSHVLEHVPDPVNFLSAIRNQLNPGGIVVITAPSYTGLIVKVLGWRWNGFQPTQHIWQLTPPTTARLCRLAGLEVLEQTSVSLDYVGSSPKILVKRILGRLGVLLKKGDQLVVIAQH